MIASLDEPTSGAVTVNGGRYRSSRAPMPELGLLLEAKAVPTGRSARNHLLALAWANGIGGRRVEEVIDLVGLRTVATTRAGGFPLGMGQRLGLASALLGNPQTGALDEPASGLDPEGVLWMRTMLTSLDVAGHNDRRNFTPTLVAAATGQWRARHGSTRRLGCCGCHRELAQPLRLSFASLTNTFRSILRHAHAHATRPSGMPSRKARRPAGRYNAADLDAARRARNTSSRPGRSGASRTSTSSYPAAWRSAWTSSRSRNRNVDSDVSVAPS